MQGRKVCSEAHVWAYCKFGDCSKEMGLAKHSVTYSSRADGKCNTGVREMGRLDPVSAWIPKVCHSESGLCV